MARPIRFRYSPEHWSSDRVRSALYDDLDANIGATSSSPWFAPPDGFEARRFDMDNGDTALFAWSDGEAFWLGNTETPKALWRTDKKGWDEVPYSIARWAQRELLAELHEQSPWLEPYPHVSWYFLPVFMSKDGRETTRKFFDEHAAGFPDATRDEALAFYESILQTGLLDDHREAMAGKLGTSEYLDLTRMTAAMGEFDAAKLLDDAGYDLTPDVEVTTGHAIDYRAERDGEEATLVEVTRPLPPSRRRAGTPAAAVRDTAGTKTSGQLAEHGGGVTLLVDCSSFPDDAWRPLLVERPDVGHRPAGVFRVRPDGRVEGYEKGRIPLDLELE